MKKTTIITTIAGLAVAFGLSACTDAEMANVERDIAQQNNRYGGQVMVDAERDCKVYVANKTLLPMAAISVSKGYASSDVIYIPVRVKWNEPFVDERGECQVVNGRTVSYRIID